MVKGLEISGFSRLESHFLKIPEFFLDFNFKSEYNIHIT